MHVPVLLTRQVFVKGAPALISLLSGIVTSVTKDALFVQSGIFVGRGVSAVAVNCGNVVAKVSTAIGVSVFGAGESVWAGALVSEAVATEGCAVVCGLQLERISIINEATMHSFLLILTSSAFLPDSKFDQFNNFAIRTSSSAL